MFLSYCSKERAEVVQLKEKLEGKELKTWFDRVQLPPGQNWLPLLEDGLLNSKAMAVCFGKSGMGPWQQEEMEAALQFAVSKKIPVIPVLLPSAPLKPELPLFLSSRTWADGRQGFDEEFMGLMKWGITGEVPEMAPLTKPESGPDREEQVREVFGPVFEELKRILGGNEQLRSLLAARFNIDDDGSGDVVAALITAFHSNYLDALGYFYALINKHSIDEKLVSDLLGHTLYLSMCPSLGERVKVGAEGRLDVPEKAKEGIIRMMMAWKDSSGRLPVPTVGLGEKEPSMIETPPVMQEQAVIRELMMSNDVNPDSHDAEDVLKAHLAFKKRAEDRQLYSLKKSNSADEAIVENLLKNPLLVDVLFLIKNPNLRLNPEVEEENYELQFEVSLQSVLKKLSPRNNS